MPLWRRDTKRISSNHGEGQASTADSIWQPLSNSAESTRVFELHAGKESTILRLTLRELLLSNPDIHYEAISYTWGTEAREKDVIINNQLHKIRVNLWDFLNCLRRPNKSRILWADAICISQNDLAEKGRQVAILGRIFGKADNVLAWLGCHANGSHDVFRIAQQASQPSKWPGFPRWPARTGEDSEKRFFTDRQKKWIDGPESSLAVQAFCNRPYWRRTWIIQEVVIADQIILHCGDSSINWSSFVCFYLHFMDYMPLKGLTRPQVLNIYDRSSTNPIEVLEDARRDWRGGGEAADLSWAISRFRRTECLDARDKIYALLSLARTKPSTTPLWPNYEANRVEVFFDVYEYCWTGHWEGSAIRFGIDLREALELQPMEVEKGFATRKYLFERLGATQDQIYRDVGIGYYSPASKWTMGGTQ